MIKNQKPLLNVIRGKEVKTPVWLMRQAGRYLPEYKKIREKSEGFIDFCLNSDLATEATLQPIRRFDLDAAIIFADILLVPFAMGQKVEFKDINGPILNPLVEKADVDKLCFNIDIIGAVLKTISNVKKNLPENVALIGFSGGLWTVACYMIEGKGKTGFGRAKTYIKKEIEFVENIFEKLHKATFEYLDAQICAGVEVIQIFESWAGLIEGEDLDKWVIKPTARLVNELKTKHPQIPIIGFPRGVKFEEYKKYAEQTGIDVISIDENVNINFAKEKIKKTIQGNLDPQTLLDGGYKLNKAVDFIMENAGEKHIFNLGHGVLPQTPPEHITEMIKRVRQWKKTEAK